MALPFLVRVVAVTMLSCGGSAPPSAPPPPAAERAVVPAPSVAADAAAPVMATSEPTRLTAAERARDASFAPPAMAVLGAFGNIAARVTSAGEVVFLSDRDGLPQLYVGETAHPNAAPRRLPGPAERVVATALTPDERAILFTSDVGGDGNFHVFRVGLDGKGLTDLTPEGSFHRDPPIFARGTRALFGYSLHAPSSEATRVLLQSAEAGPAREVYTDDRGGELADLSPDGTRALFVRINSDEDTVLFEIEVATGRAVRLFPPEGSIAKVYGVYSAAADRIYASRLVEDHAPEVVALDRRSGKVLARYEDVQLPRGDVRDLAVSSRGDRIAISVDGGSHSEIRVLDARTLRLERTLDVPVGATMLGSFTKDGSHFTITQSRPVAPHDVFLVDAKTGAVRPLRGDERPGLATMAPVRTTIESIAGFDGLPLSTNVHLPAQVTGRLPTLVVIHGGPSASAYVRWSAPTRFFSSLGYAIVEPNIRGSNGFGVAFQKADDKEKRGDALKDVATVNAWARAQPWCDPERIVIMGGSYGGYMTLLALGRQPRLWRAGVDISGMSDLRTMEALEDQAIRVYDETEFGVLGREDALLYEWSPLKSVQQIVAPVFIYQGARDPITPQKEADQMVKALRERGVLVEYMLLADEGHGIVRKQNNIEYLTRAARFLADNASAR